MFVFFPKSQAQEAAPAASAAAPPTERELVGRGRQRGAPGPFSGDGNIQSSHVLFLTSGDLGYSFFS